MSKRSRKRTGKKEKARLRPRTHPAAVKVPRQSHGSLADVSSGPSPGPAHFEFRAEGGKAGPSQEYLPVQPETGTADFSREVGELAGMTFSSGMRCIASLSPWVLEILFFLYPCHLESSKGPQAHLWCGPLAVP